MTAGGATVPHRVVPGGHEFVGFAASRPLATGPAHLQIRFKASMNSKGSNGVFRNKAGDDWYEFTQFEVLATRRGFPASTSPPTTCRGN